MRDQGKLKARHPELSHLLERDSVGGHLGHLSPPPQELPRQAVALQAGLPGCPGFVGLALEAPACSISGWRSKVGRDRQRPLDALHPHPACLPWSQCPVKSPWVRTVPGDPGRLVSCSPSHTAVGPSP